jgi:hypothetical protein
MGVNTNSNDNIDSKGEYAGESSNNFYNENYNENIKSIDYINDNLTNEIETENKLPILIFSYFNIKNKPSLENKINCIQCKKFISIQQNNETLNEIVKYDICTRCYFHKNCLKIRLINGNYYCNHDRDFRIDYRINNK